MRKRILRCDDDILEDKYFILTRFINKLQTYFYNEVELFFLNTLVNNKELLTLEKIDNFEECYLNDENYKIFKIIYYEDILIELEKINNLFKNFNDHLLKKNKYNIEDFYICLDYIQERSIYLDLKNYIERKDYIESNFI